MMVAVMGMEIARPFVDSHDEDGSHHAPEKVAAEGGSVAPAQHDVSVHERLAVLRRDLTHEAEHLGLAFVERDLVKAPGLQVEEA